MTERNPVAESLELPAAPVLPGLTFRRFRGAADYPLMAELANLCSKANGDEFVTTAESIQAQHEHPSGYDPFQDMIFIEADGQLIAYSRAEWRQIENGPRVYMHMANLHPAWRRQGLGTAMLRWNERRLREIAASHGAVGEKVLRAHGIDINPGECALFEREGYSVVRYGYDMVRDLLEPIEDAPLPTGLAIRPVTAADYRAIWDADVEAFRDHWGFSEPDAVDYQRWQASPFFQPAMWKIGWAGTEVAGMVLGFVNREENQERGVLRGYTEGISVRRPWRRLGLARALLTNSMLMFREMGMTEAALGVDAENPNGALKLYTDVGFKVARQGFTYQKSLED